ncbi:hypothetical protein, partial [Sphingobacterium athyrii]|uniref:hypothetical protein n=1 Tax=Sphingobacterium athyrii TaxID=2152717 RepID=UPI0028A6AEEF
KGFFRLGHISFPKDLLFVPRIFYLPLPILCLRPMFSMKKCRAGNPRGIATEQGSKKPFRIAFLEGTGL